MIEMSDVMELTKETKKYLRKYDYDKVLVLCDKILDINPRSRFGLEFKAISLYRKKQYTESLNLYKKLNRIFYDDEEILYSLMLINEDIGEYETALEYSKRLLGLHYTDHYHNRYKYLSCKLNDVGDLIDNLNSQIKSLEEDDDKQLKRLMAIYEQKAIYEYMDGDYENAKNDYKKLLEYYSLVRNSIQYNQDEINNWYEFLSETITGKDAREALDNLFDIKDNIKIWTDKLDTMHSLTQFANPLAYSYILLDKYPDNPDLLKITAKIAYNHDDDYLIECYQKILELEPENEDAINSLLHIYKSYYLKDESLKLIDSKLYIDNLKEDLLVKKIELLESMTRYDEALDTYDEYLSIKKPDGLIYHKKTIFDKLRCMEQQATDYYIEGRFLDAFNIYKQVNEVFKGIEDNSSRISGDEWRTEGWYENILDKSLSESKSNAENFFNNFYTLTADNIQLWTEKIDSLVSWNHFGNPIQLCDILIKHNPDNTRIHLAKADVYYRTKRISTALNCYEDILKKNPDNAEALNRKFNLLVRHHKYRQAYVLFNSMQIDYNTIRSDLEDLADALLRYYKYRQALTCYNLMMDHGNYGGILKKVKLIWDKLDDKESQENSKYYLDWIDAIEFKYKDNKCPHCGGQLIPITYGYVVCEPDDDVYLGGCCVGDNSPTDYCRKCRKEVHMGTYGIVISDEDYGLYSYARNLVIWLTKYLERYPKKTIKQLKRESYKMFSLDKVEFDKFLEKLVEIEYITINKNHIKIAEDYKVFHMLFV